MGRIGEGRGKMRGLGRKGEGGERIREVGEGEVKGWE